jgi:hypothetical protein
VRVRRGRGEETERGNDRGAGKRSERERGKESRMIMHKTFSERSLDNDYKMVVTLIAMGANVDMVDYDKRSPLHIAATTGTRRREGLLMKMREKRQQAGEEEESREGRNKGD